MAAFQDSVAAQAPGNPITWRGAAILAACFAGLANFYGLLSTLAADPAVAGDAGAIGLANGALLMAAVLVEPVAPFLLGRWGYRRAMRVALGLIGLATLGLVWNGSAGGFVALNALRGLGFGMLFVAGAPMLLAVTDRAKTAAAISVYGVVAGVPAVVMLPVAVMMAASWGVHDLYLLCGLLALGGALILPRAPRAEAARAVSLAELLGLCRATAMPAAMFAAAAVASGAAVTFLPQLAGEGGAIVPIALLVNGVAMVIGRAATSRLTGRFSSAGILAAAALLSGAGLVAIALVHAPVVLAIGMALIGGGFGVAQNVALLVMFEAAPEQRDVASAGFSLLYDAGLGLGAWATGLMAAGLGLPAACCLAGVTVAVVAAIGRLVRRLPA